MNIRFTLQAEYAGPEYTVTLFDLSAPLKLKVAFRIWYVCTPNAAAAAGAIARTATKVMRISD